MLKKYIENKHIKNMFNVIEDYNVNKYFDENTINKIVRLFLNRTMIFISVYSMFDIRDKIIYCINFIIDKCLIYIDNDTKNQLHELLITINAYPLVSKILPLSSISENYVETLKINLRKYGRFYYTDKQIELYSKIYSQNQDVIFSAPTSYGKTHLSLMTILDMMSDSIINNVLIIVPTKALINDYRKTINRLNQKMIVNILESPYIHPNYKEKNIFIYTQERTLVAVDYANLNSKIDIVLIDEAQSLADILNDRTLLLIKALSYFTNTPKIYLAPFVQNIYKNVISKLINSSNSEFSMELNSNDSVVSNNKYIIDITIPNKIIWYNATFAKSQEDLIKIKEYSTNKLALFDDDAYSNAIDIIFDSYDNFINANEKSIIYIASKVESMNIALKIYNRLQDKKAVPTPRVTALINHLETNIHDKFLMLNFIKRGIAYHNSCLDSYTKRQLEYIIGSDDNYIDKLVCTNTIESGVNLSAKNIFVLIKSRLQGKQPEIKYANLLGRAARLSSNTQGNLFYIKMSTKYAKYEQEFYKSNEIKNIKTSNVTLDDIKKDSNVTYRSFLEDNELVNSQKEEFLSKNSFKVESNIISNGEINLKPRNSNGLDYYIDTDTIKKSESIILNLSQEQINKYLNCLGNYDDTKEFIEFLSGCYDWKNTCNNKIKNRMKDINLISTIITFLVQGRSIKDIVDNRIDKMDKGEYNLYVDIERNYVKKLKLNEVNDDSNYVLFDKNNLEHLNSLIINSLDQTQSLIEFHVKKYIQDFYYRLRKLHGNSYESDDIGNFLEFSAIDDNKIILIENGIIDNFALNEFSKAEYLKFYNNRKIDLKELLSYVEIKFTNESPYYYAIKDIM